MKNLVASALVCLTLASGCNRNENKNEASTDQNEARDSISAANTATPDDGNFDIEQIPVSTSELGPFPFFSLPEGIISNNKPIERKFDKLFFAIDGKMVPLEGRVWKSFLFADKDQEFSLPFVEKSYDQAILDAGGVKIFDGTISKEEYDRFSPSAPYLGEDASIGYTSENIKTYLIKRSDQGNIYIQLSGTNASGKINVLQEEGFRQTIKLLKAEEITKELSEKGKVVMYINFDTDKATLKPDGKQAVDEIAKALKTNKDLALQVNGHTDNTGDAQKNLILSKNRSKAVVDALIGMEIEKSRLTSNGFGAENPIADNSTEEGKSKNRRVELIKK
jgi:outer membrane protein OmpA-like peptidoglycan-associated protein